MENVGSSCRLMFLLDQIPQYVWGMENGNQTQGKWNAKVLTTLCYAIIVITSFTLKYFNMEKVQCILDINMQCETDIQCH